MIDLRMIGATDNEGRPLWKVLKEYEHNIGPGCNVVVPAGYVTNLGTVPRLFYSVVAPGELQHAAVVHDWMCNEDFLNDGKSINSGYSRWLADAVLYEMLGAMGFPLWKRIFVFAGVRLGSLYKGKAKWPKLQKS